MRILFTGGGSGGHLFPIIAVAREIKNTFQNEEEALPEMFFLGANGFSKSLLVKEGIKVRTIMAGKIRRYFSIKNVFDLLVKFPLSFLQSFFYLFIWMPDVIFSKGGHGGFWVVFIGWLFRIPVMVHESDAIPGLVTKTTAPFAKRVALSFEEAGKYFPSKKTALVGNPVRLKQVSGPERNKRSEGLGLTKEKPLLFVMGGSQGAQKINDLIISLLPKLCQNYQIIHQCGRDHYKAIKEKSARVKSSNYYLFSFLNEQQIRDAYLLSELVISRAGAGSIFEIAAAGKPSIIIPLPQSASDHQRANAFAYARYGACSVLEQANITPHLVLGEIRKIISDEELRRQMAEGARRFSQPKAGLAIAQELIEIGS